MKERKKTMRWIIIIWCLAKTHVLPYMILCVYIYICTKKGAQAKWARKKWWSKIRKKKNVEVKEEDK